ncbi:MAG: HEAT repeat domain-containing protein [Microcystaceae cyanobacterium]
MTVLTPSDTDELLKKVNQQIANNTFDVNDVSTIKQMVECLGDTRGMVRLGFAEALGAVGKPATPFVLEGLANHENPVVRRACGKTLTLIGDDTAVPTLIHSLLNDEDTVVKGSCVGALAKSGKTAIPELLKILTSPDHPQSIKGHVSWALGFMGSQARDPLLAVMSSDSEEVRMAVVSAFSNIAEEQPEDQQAFQVLIDALGDTSVNVRAEAASALGKLGRSEAIPHLINMLTSSQSDNRKASALALMKIRDESGLKPLQTALEQEPDEAIKPILKLAISQIEKALD